MPSDHKAIRRSLNDIRYHIVLARTFVEGMSYDALRDDLRTTYAVTRSLRSSPKRRAGLDELKARHPSIAWKNMAGAGNVYRHDYEDVAVSLVWVVLEDHLPPLLIVVAQELAALDSP